MGQDVFSLFQLQRKKLLCLIAITFALILSFQYFHLPYANFLLVPTSNSTSSSSSSSIFHAADSPYVSEIFNNITLSNQTHLEEHSLQKVNQTRVYDGNETISGTGLVSEQGRVLNNSLESNTIGMNFTREVQAIAPTYLIPPPTISPPIKVLLNDSEITGSMNDERFKPLKDDVNVIDNNSSITTVPKETKDSIVKVPEVTSISEMQKLLLQNYASYRSMVCE
jgi:hypothetical protein